MAKRTGKSKELRHRILQLEGQIMSLKAIIAAKKTLDDQPVPDGLMVSNPTKKAPE
jgi:hypothetical protein